MLTTTLSKDYSQEPHEHVPCPLCHAERDYVLARRGYPGVPLTNVICKNCALIRIDPRMTREGYEKFYKEDFFEYLNPYDRPAYIETIERTTDPSFVTPAERSLMPYILPFVREGGKVLDVGAGFGQILYLLKRDRNIIPYGMEPDPHSRKIAREKMGIEVEDATIESYLAASKETFDFIVLDQVFEHLLEPLSTLTELGKRLASDGVIYIGVPGAYNPAIPMALFYQLAHTYNYTPATMNRFARDAGLKVISVRDPEGPVLEVLLARSDSSYREAPLEQLAVGGEWKEMVRRLRRKRFLNMVRGSAKAVLVGIIGEQRKERVRTAIDRLIRYRY